MNSTPDTPVSCTHRHKLMSMTLNTPKKTKFSGIRDMLISAFFANLQAVLVKTLSSKVTEVLFIRSIVLLLGYTGHLLFTGRFRLLTNSFSPQMVSIGTLGALGICLFYYTLDFLMLTEAISIYSFCLVLNSIFRSIFFKEPGPNNMTRVIFCSLFGIVLVAQPGFFPSDNNKQYSSETQGPTIPHFLAVILCLVSTLFASGSQLITKKVSQEEEEANIVIIYVNALIFLIVGGFILHLSVFASIDFIDMLKIAGIAAGNVIGIAFANKALTSSSFNFISAFSYTQVIYSLLWDIFLFKQIPDVWTLIGSALLIGSCLFLLLK